MTTESTLRAALQDLEVCANTVAGCYTRNPGNFAAALRDLQESAERARAALSAHPARASQEPDLDPMPYGHRDITDNDPGPQEQGELSDEQLDKIDDDFVLHHMAPRGRESVRGFARAVVAADRAARPESVDARRYRLLRCFVINGYWPNHIEPNPGLIAFSAAHDDQRKYTQDRLDKMLDDMLGLLPHHDPERARADYQAWRAAKTQDAIDAATAKPMMSADGGKDIPL